MNIKIKATHGFLLTEEVKDYAYEKINEAASKFDKESNKISLIEIELGKTNSHHQKGENYMASLQVHIDGKNIILKEIDKDIHISIDKLKSKLELSLSKNKDKNKSLRNRLGSKFKRFLK